MIPDEKQNKCRLWVQHWAILADAPGPHLVEWSINLSKLHHIEALYLKEKMPSVLDTNTVALFDKMRGCARVGDWEGVAEAIEQLLLHHGIFNTRDHYSRIIDALMGRYETYTIVEPRPPG